MQNLQSDLRCALQIAANTFSSHHHHRSIIPFILPFRCSSRSLSLNRLRILSFSTSSSEPLISGDEVDKKRSKPLICTADELHYVSVPNTDWRLALWRYTPPPKAPKRNHPLLLLSGVGTNAIGYDLSPESSFARHMSKQGFDTWILEVRGAGLSTRGTEADKIAESVESGSISDVARSSDNGATNGTLSVEQQSNSNSTSSAEADTSVVKRDDEIARTVIDESQLVAKLTDTLMLLSERLADFMNEGQLRVVSDKLLIQISRLLADARLLERFNQIGEKISSLLEARQKSAISAQVRELSQRLVSLVEDSQRSVSEVPPQLLDLQERFAATLDVFQKQLDLIVHYDWDFDNYLEEDVPAAMEYIRSQTNPKDGKMIAIGHSMGGILLYAMLARSGCEERNSGLAAVVTLASSLDYRSSNSSLKLLIPLADPAQALNVPVIPLGTLLAAAYPLTSLPPYAFAWLNTQISAGDMMHPELLKKLMLNNFCTIPAKLLLQLTTAFREGGLRDRSGTFPYKDHLHKTNVPVLAFAGDKDLICPPVAVLETAKLIPEHLVTYKLVGQPGGPHYAHYDLVGGRMAVKEVYPCIVDFIVRHDRIESEETAKEK
ncbi:hypothetical protein ACHQM5_005558 [Ranunculus cassubicifolius]